MKVVDAVESDRGGRKNRVVSALFYIFHLARSPTVRPSGPVQLRRASLVIESKGALVLAQLALSDHGGERGMGILLCDGVADGDINDRMTKYTMISSGVGRSRTSLWDEIGSLYLLTDDYSKRLLMLTEPVSNVDDTRLVEMIKCGERLISHV